MTPEFTPFPKISRLNRECWVTEKLDGTNSTVAIFDADGRPVPCAIAEWTAADGRNLFMLAGSRTRWITPEQDNHGFAKWVSKHAEELKGLGEGIHRGEWWGSGIQRGYGLKNGEKRFSLFNVQRWCLAGTEPKRIETEDPRIEKWQEELPTCCELVPVLYRGQFDTLAIDGAIASLQAHGSFAVDGFDDPEGVVVYHTAGNVAFKRTIKNDDKPKSKP